jgi:uncharacterized membrane protein
MKKNWHKSHEERMSFGDRIADKVANFIGSWPFIILQLFLLIVWAIFNAVQFTHLYHFDEFPFVFMNLFMSMEAAFSTPLIMMAQNMSSDRDREQAQHDYDTNIESEKRIEELQLAIARLDTEKLDKIIELLEA